METTVMIRYLLCLLLAGLAGCSSLPDGVYKSPGAAVDSLVSALRTGDDAKLQTIFGEDGAEILNSGDEVADKNDAANFLKAYDERNVLVAESTEKVTLSVGRDGWPFPVPIVKNAEGWFFDTAAGKDELLNRRIGRNELDTIQVCLAIADAQHDYAKLDPEKVGLPVYASKIVSDPDKKNGLYWRAKEGEPESPLGELVAQAADDGYGATTKPADGVSAPYHGYRYRLLKSQGDKAPGGAMEYVVDGRLLGGFAVLAYPADYGNSGIMAFTVNQQGVVHQKDLGEQTEKLARAVETYNPDDTWKAVPKSDTDTENGPADR
jgi:hypothetical protein